MQSPFPGYWKDMDVLTRDSKSILSQNHILQKRLDELNSQIQYRDAELYNVETRLENLDIFEQHLTSLNLRCEFLDKQVSNLESKHRYVNHISLPSLSNITTPHNGMREFKDRTSTNSNSTKIEWRTTETTLENLCTEFSYLKDQLNIANNHSGMDTSMVDDSSFSNHSTTDRSTSIFSDQEVPSMDDEYNTSNILNVKDGHTTSSSVSSSTISHSKSSQKKKKLLKMESFLNFADNMEPKANATNPEKDVVPLRGFKINTMHDNPLCDDTVTMPRKVIKGKASIKSMKKKLELVELPSIVEEEPYSQSECDEDADGDDENETEDEYHELSIAYDSRFHRRHNSLPENSSLDGNNIILSSDESIRHFTSYDTGLNSRFNHKNYDVCDFLFAKPTQMDKIEHNTLPVSHLTSSSPFSTFKASYIDDESYYEDNNLHSKAAGSLLLDSDSDESYGDENVTPLLLKKESQLSLYKCNSHESIFSAINTTSKSIRHFPLREKNLDLKAQTMKWLKPNMPLVSSSLQPFVQPLKVTANNNAHHDIMNILGANKENISTPATPIKSAASSVMNTPVSQHTLTSNRIPVSSPMLINGGNDSPTQNTSSDGPISSWLSSFIPNSAFTNPEIGKFIGQPSGKNVGSNTSIKNNSVNSRSKNGQSPFVLTPVNFRKVKTNFNGPSSSLTINKNGEKIITHGYGSGFNNNNVISSRVSHGALREALEHDMIF